MLGTYGYSPTFSEVPAAPAVPARFTCGEGVPQDATRATVTIPSQYGILLFSIGLPPCVFDPQPAHAQQASPSVRGKSTRHDVAGISVQLDYRHKMRRF